MKANLGIALAAGMFLTALTSAQATPLSINPPSGTLASGQTNQPYTQALLASGGSGSYSWSITTQSAGLNLALTATTGANTSLTGTPTVANTGLTITVRLTDTEGETSLQQTYTIPVFQGSPAGAQFPGTKAYVLNEDGSLVSVAGGAATSLVAANSCSGCLFYDLTSDAAGNLIIAAGSQLKSYSSTGASRSAILAPNGTKFVSVAVDAGGNYIVADIQNPPSIRHSALDTGQLLKISPTSAGPPQVVATFPAANGDVYVRVDSSGNYILATDSYDPAFSLFRITPPGSSGPVPNCASLSNGCTAITISPTGESPAPAAIGGLTFDAQGNYIIVDWSNDIIFTITPSGSSTPLFSDPNEVLSDPLGIFREPQSGLFFLVDDDNDALCSLTPDGSTLSVIASGMLFAGGPDAVVVEYTPPPPAPTPVYPPLSLTTSSLPNGTVGLLYGPVAMSATGGSGNFLWSVSAAPPGVTISPVGVLSSATALTAAAAGSYSAVRVTVLDITTGLTQTGQFAITIFAPLSVTTSSLPSGSAGATYGPVTMAATGGSGNYSWSVGGAPAGVTITAAGVLSSSTALAASTLGTYSITTKVIDTTANATASSTFSVTIYPALSVTTAVLPDGSAGQIYGPVTMAATGGSGKYAWSVSGAPQGVTMTTAGVLTSNSALTTSAVGSYPSVTVIVTDTIAQLTAKQTFTVVISYGQLTLGGPANLGGFVPGASVSASYPALGGDPPYAWSTPQGLPTGLALNPSTGSLTGSIATPGNYNFQIQVSDSQPASAGTSLNVALFVLGISTTSLPNASLNVAYTQTLGVIGGTPPYKWSVTGGALPPGLSLATSGVLTGAPISSITPLPSAGVTSSFTVSVTSGSVTVSAPLTLTVTQQILPLTIPGGDLAIPVTLPSGAVSIPYSQTLQAINGKPPYSWSLIGGKLAPGLSLSGSGTLSGTPNLAGTFQFTCQVTDTAGAAVASAFSVTIAPPALTITNGSPLPNGIAGSDYPPQIITAVGGTPPYTYQSSGALPGGLTFSAGGQLSGIPTAAGASEFTVAATDSSLPTPLTTTASFQLAVEPAHPDLILSQASLAFSLNVGASAPPSGASISVRSSVAALILNYSVNVTPAASWLDVTSGASTPGAIAINIDPSALSLPAGNLQTSIAVTCIAPSPCAGNSQTINVTLNITTAPPQLTVTSNLLSFSAQTSNPQPVSQTLGLQNTGGGTITVNSVTAADSFVTITGVPATIPAGPAVPVTVTVNPSGLAANYFQSSVLVSTSAGLAIVPVALLVSQSPTMTLSPSGTEFQMPAGAAPGNPSGSFLVGVSGSSAVNWSAALLAPVSWLTLNTSSGTSTSANPGTVSFSINPTAATLAPQAYYASIQVTSSSVVDSPLSFVVVLNVTSAATPVRPDPEPPGLLFISNGSGTLPLQTVQVFSSSTPTVTYQAASDSSWLKVNPNSGSTSSTSPGSSSVSVYLNGLAPGVYHGNVSYALSSAAVRSVNVTLIVEAAPTSSLRPRTPCSPSHLVPTQTGLANNFAQPTSWPTPLAVLLVNDCGQPVSSAQVVATFSNGDPPLALSANNGASGIYAGTWTPRNSSGQVTIAARATATGFPAATAQIVGQVTPNAAPLLTKNGTLNVFAPVLGAPVAPGTIVQIYGSNLASQATPAATIPLPMNLNQTSVLIGGLIAPLYYVSPGQINAQVPFELAPGNPYQVIVSANGALSTPNPIQLTSDAPGIAQFPAGEIIAQHLNGNLVLETSPAAPGEIIQMYVAGMGLTNQSVPSGTASPSTNLAVPLDTPTLTLNGAPITNILFAGLTPTLVGLYQVDFQVPANTPNGDLQLVLTQTSGLTNSAILPVHN